MGDFRGKIRDLMMKIKERETIHQVSTWLQQYKFKLLKGIGITVGTLGLVVAISGFGNHYVKINTNEVFHVYMEDEQIGTVSAPEVVEKFILAKIYEFQKMYPDVHMVLNADDITYQPEKAFKLTSDDEFVLEQLDDKLVAHAIGVELHVDGKLIGIVKDVETAEAILDQIQNKYLPEKKAGRVGILSFDEEAEPFQGDVQIEEVEFIEEVQFETTQIRPQDIIDPEEMIRKLETGDVKPTKYIVQQGDCINCIAERFNISPQIIYENNEWIEDDFLQIGDELDLTVLQPTLSVKTVERVEKIQDVHYDTIYEYDDTLKVGNNITIRPGVEGKKLMTYLHTKVNGIMTTEELIDEEMIEEPISAIVRKGTKIIKGEGTGSFGWPVKNAKQSSGYGMRWGRLHAGIDFTSKNRDIFAADSGTVTFAGSGSGYGNYIIIDHKNGFTTLYGHLSKINTTKGAKVEKGEKIGVMGNTGNSTGVHLHFEIRKNGSSVNPAKYLNK